MLWVNSDNGTDPASVSGERSHTIQLNAGLRGHILHDNDVSSKNHVDFELRDHASMHTIHEKVFTFLTVTYAHVQCSRSIVYLARTRTIFMSCVSCLSQACTHQNLYTIHLCRSAQCRRSPCFHRQGLQGLVCPERQLRTFHAEKGTYMSQHSLDRTRNAHRYRSNF
jgi:hypothetical protein